MIFRKLSQTVPDIFKKDSTVRQVYRCNPLFHGRPQYDWVALSSIWITAKTGKISDFNIAQLQLLFQFQHEGTIFNLACVQHFKMYDERDPETGMYILERVDSYEVIPVSAIEHNVHLIPYFDNPSSARDSLNKRCDEYSFQKYLLNHFSDRYIYICCN